MDNVRPATSARSRLLADPQGASVADPATADRVGKPGPFGRERCVYALPLNPGPALLRAPALIRDPLTANLADPAQTLVGLEPVWVNRMLVALPTEDTRRLA